MPAAADSLPARRSRRERGQLLVRVDLAPCLAVPDEAAGGGARGAGGGLGGGGRRRRGSGARLGRVGRSTARALPDSSPRSRGRLAPGRGRTRPSSPSVRAGP